MGDGAIGRFLDLRIGDMHDPANELRRIDLPRRWVNKGTRKGRGCSGTPALFGPTLTDVGLTYDADS